MKLEQNEVDSSNIKKITFTNRLGDEDGVLLVSFNNGSRYAYDDVPAQVAMDFIAAESAGKFFNKNIRNQYISNRADEPEPEEKE